MQALSKTPVLYPSAALAAQAVAIYDALCGGHMQYEISPVRTQDFKIEGFYARAKDLDGFGIGYVGLPVSK
jgi:hypothetical protein